MFDEFNAIGMENVQASDIIKVYYSSMYRVAEHLVKYLFLMFMLVDSVTATAYSQLDTLIAYFYVTPS